MPVTGLMAEEGSVVKGFVGKEVVMRLIPSRISKIIKNGAGDNLPCSRNYNKSNRRSLQKS